MGLKTINSREREKYAYERYRPVRRRRPCYPSFTRIGEGDAVYRSTFPPALFFVKALQNPLQTPNRKAQDVCPKIRRPSKGMLPVRIVGKIDDPNRMSLILSRVLSFPARHTTTCPKFPTESRHQFPPFSTALVCSTLNSVLSIIAVGFSIGQSSGCPSSKETASQRYG
jgi:hypothetical protein